MVTRGELRGTLAVGAQGMVPRLCTGADLGCHAALSSAGDLWARRWWLQPHWVGFSVGQKRTGTNRRRGGRRQSTFAELSAGRLCLAMAHTD